MVAKDIMTRDIITVNPTMTVKNLAMTLIKNQISGAPVSAKNGKIVGVVSETDILVKKGKDVKAIMSKKIVSVKEETPVEEIAQLMTTHKIKRLPVMRGDAVVGIVSRADIVSAVGRLAGQDRQKSGHLTSLWHLIHESFGCCEPDSSVANTTILMTAHLRHSRTGSRQGRWCPRGSLEQSPFQRLFSSSPGRRSPQFMPRYIAALKRRR